MKIGMRSNWFIQSDSFKDLINIREIYSNNNQLKEVQSELFLQNVLLQSIRLNNNSSLELYTNVFKSSKNIKNIIKMMNLYLINL